jgi:S-formylglutathione hydrolase FrmB
VTDLEVLGDERLSPRLRELTVFSPALRRPSSLRVLTPSGFDATRDRLPVLWLLHGGGPESDHTNWTDRGDAEAVTAAMPLVVVMPDGGRGGWYADWVVGETSQGPQRWETHHLRELLPFVQRRFGTRVDRGGTAIAGLSMGGFGAMHHAARHPELFGFAASFSGAVDNRHRGIARTIRASPLIMGGERGDIFGPIEDEAAWRANNPVDLAENLATVEVQLRTGTGQPEGDTQEIGCAQATATLHRRLVELGIPHLYDEHPGTHTWPCWTAALTATLPAMLAAFER